jgi:hypothetical protein
LQIINWSGFNYNFFFYKVQIMMINLQNDDFDNKLSNFWSNMDTFSRNKWQKYNGNPI